jgi:hypothetical protein
MNIASPTTGELALLVASSEWFLSGSAASNMGLSATHLLSFTAKKVFRLGHVKGDSEANPQQEAKRAPVFKSQQTRFGVIKCHRFLC